MLLGLHTWSCNMMGHRHGISPGWARKVLYFYQAMVDISHKMEEGLQSSWEIKWEKKKKDATSFFSPIGDLPGKSVSGSS